MRKILLLTILIVAFSELPAQLKKFTVDVPYLPKVKISDSIQSIVILNRSMTPEFSNFNSDSLQVSYYKKNFHADQVLLDSLVADTTVKAIGDVLFDSYRFDVVIPVERNIKRTLSYTKTPDSLDWEYVKSMCKYYNTDAMLVLENFATRSVTDFSRKREYIYDDIYINNYASIDIYYRLHWKLYDPATESVIVDIIDSDTVFWDGEDPNVKTLFSLIPSVKDACIKAGIYAAVNFAETIAPKWKSETRFYFVTKEEDVDQSITFASEGTWDKALENWMKYTSTGQNSARSKVMLNVALAYEMLGDIDSAILWANTSQKTYYREVSNHYYNQLIKRKSERNK